MDIFTITRFTIVEEMNFSYLKIAFVHNFLVSSLKSQELFFIFSVK
jgi:hypothetical protein